MINKQSTIENKILKKFISKQILETINIYLYLDFGEKIIIKFNNEYLPIIDFIFNIDEENLDIYSESICGLLNLPLNKENMRNLAQIIFSKVMKFKEVFFYNHKYHQMINKEIFALHIFNIAKVSSFVKH